ncbi:hypothetical protein V6N13_123587 [Hibiscus sabdariffa]
MPLALINTSNARKIGALEINIDDKDNSTFGKIKVAALLDISSEILYLSLKLPRTYKRQMDQAQRSTPLAVMRMVLKQAIRIPHEASKLRQSFQGVIMMLRLFVWCFVLSFDLPFCLL